MPFGETQKIKRFKAQTLKNYVETDDGQFWFWGGYFYQNYHKLCIDGFNLLNEEEGIPKGAKIAEYGMGFAHESVLIDDEDPKIVDL